MTKQTKLDSWERLIIDTALQHYQDNMREQGKYTQLAQDQFRALRDKLEQAQDIICEVKNENNYHCKSPSCSREQEKWNDGVIGRYYLRGPFDA